MSRGNPAFLEPTMAKVKAPAKPMPFGPASKSKPSKPAKSSKGGKC